MRNENEYENENKNKRDDMAKVREGEIRGKVRSGLGNVVVYGEKDDARVRSVGEPTKQVSDLQYWYKAKMANVVKLYKHLEPIVNQAWDERLAPRKKNGTAKGAPYNWFMSANMQERGCALWPKEDHPGGCLAVPYQVTNGLLEPIRVVPIDEDGKSMKRTIDDCPRARTNVKIGALVVNEETSVSAFAEAILQNNDGWEWGDTLLYVQVEQKVQTMGVMENNEPRKLPYVQERHWMVPIEAEGQMLSEVVDLRWVQNVNGYVGQGEETGIGGYCWVHLRGVTEPETPEVMSDEEIRERMEEVLGLEEEDEYLLPEEEVMPTKEKKRRERAVWQKWESSTQKLVCNNRELIAEFRSDEHVRMVIERYRALAKVPKKKRAVEEKDSWTGKKLDWRM